MKNLTIAKLHRFSRKLVGWITAVGPVIAYILSIITIVVGVIIYAVEIWPDAWLYWIAAGLIGLLFSLLVERLTLTQAAKVRVASEKKEDIETAHALVEKPTAEVEAAKERKLKAIKTGGAMPLMVAGALISTCAGTLFWHYLFQRMPVYQAWGFSTLFSALISFTLVSSELHRRIENEVIASSITADHFTDMALKEDTRDRVIEEFADQHEEALRETLGGHTVRDAADYAAQRTLDEVLDTGQGLIPQHISRERELARQREINEQHKTDQQFEIIRSAGAPKDEKPKGLLSRAIGAFKPVVDEHSSNGKEPNFR